MKPLKFLKQKKYIEMTDAELEKERKAEKNGAVFAMLGSLLMLVVGVLYLFTSQETPVVESAFAGILLGGVALLWSMAGIYLASLSRIEAISYFRELKRTIGA